MRFQMLQFYIVSKNEQADQSIIESRAFETTIQSTAQLLHGSSLVCFVKMRYHGTQFLQRRKRHKEVQ